MGLELKISCLAPSWQIGHTASMMWSFIESEKCSPFWLSQLYISYLMSLHSDCICLFSSTLIRCSYQIHLIPWAWKKLEWTKHGTENCEIFPMLLLVSCILKLCLLKYAWFRWSTGTSYSFFIGVRLLLWSSLMPPTSARVCDLSQSQPDKWPFGLILLSSVTCCSLQEWLTLWLYITY